MEKKYIIAILFATLVSFLLIAFGEGNKSFLQINTGIITQIQSFESVPVTNVMIFISSIGEWFVYFPIACLFILLPNTRFKLGIPSLITLIATCGVNYFLKGLFAVERPHFHRLISESGFGFPSAHAMVGTAFISFCTYNFLKSSYKMNLKILAIIISVFFIEAVGLSRVYLGVHFPSDIIGGYLAGIFMSAFSILIFQSFDSSILSSFRKQANQ